MARTLYPAQVAQNYSEAKWSLADDNAQDETKPVAGDTIICTVASGVVTCDEAWAAAGLTATGACVWAFGAQTGTLSGAIDLADITATAGGGALVLGGDFDIGTDGTLTLSDDQSITAVTFEMAGGTVVSDGNTLTVNGNVLYTSGTATVLILTQSGTATVSWSSPFGSMLNMYTVDTGAVITTAGAIETRSAVIKGAISGAHELLLTAASAGWWGVQTGTVDCPLTVLVTSNSPGNDITLETGNIFTIKTDSAHTLTFDANLNLTGSQVKVYGTGAGDLMTVGMGANSLKCGALTIGTASVNTGSGVLNLGSGTHEIASLVDGNAANGSNALNFGTGVVTATGTYDGTNIDIDNTSCHITGGMVSNVDNSGNATLFVHNGTDGGGNTNVEFLVKEWWANQDLTQEHYMLLAVGM